MPSVALLLLGGVACVPLLIDALLSHSPQPASALPLLALSRAHHEREAASVAVAGVVASLALAVALTVMVASFRDGVARWLDQVLPADLYLRSATQSGAADQAYLSPAFVNAAQRLPGVARLEAARTRPLNLVADQPAVVLISRPLADPAASLSLVSTIRCTRRRTITSWARRLESSWLRTLGTGGCPCASSATRRRRFSNARHFDNSATTVSISSRRWGTTSSACSFCLPRR